MKPIYILLSTFLVASILGVTYYFGKPDQKVKSVSQNLSYRLSETKLRIKRNSNLAETLIKSDVDSIDIHELVQAARPVRDLGVLRAGTQFHTLHSLGPINEFLGIELKFNPVYKLRVHKAKGAWAAEEIRHPVKTQLVNFASVVETSLWDSALSANMQPQLIAELTEIFAWQVDFNREVRKGDRWRLTVEQKFANDEPIGWGRIISAEYQNEAELYTAVLYRRGEDDLGYFAPDGTSLRRMFLKSPIRFGRITSRFNRRRFHPILKRRRPHLGVDYGAPRGTPVRSVGEGRVLYAAWKGGGGKTIKIRHNSVYQTAYKHLKGYARGIRKGARVKQGQIIGYVGSTGLSTGPHLHFEFYENRRFIDPLSKKFPSADPVPKKYIDDFLEEAKVTLKTLPPWHRPGVTPIGPVRVLAHSLQKKSQSDKSLSEK